MNASISPLGRITPSRFQNGRNYARRYWGSALPAAIVVAAVIVVDTIYVITLGGPGARH